MKLALIIDDEAWFWVLNADNTMWECSYEIDQGDGNSITTRLDKMDRHIVSDVVAIMGDMTIAALIN